MKISSRRLVLVLTVSLLCAAVSFAQEKTKGASTSAAQQPAQRQVVIKSIFDYKLELAITDRQEKDLRAVLTNLQDYMTAKKKELDALRGELSKLITEKADLKKIRTALGKIAKIQADASYEDVVRAREVEKKLTVDQLSKWHDIQEDFMKNLQAEKAAAEAAAKAKEAKK